MEEGTRTGFNWRILGALALRFSSRPSYSYLHYPSARPVFSGQMELPNISVVSQGSRGLGLRRDVISARA